MKNLFLVFLLFIFYNSRAQQSTFEKAHTKNMDLVDQSVNFKHMKISSNSFPANGKIPSKYTCDGKNINPALEINAIPELTKSLALIVDDPDAPVGIWVHWLVWNIPVLKQIRENSIPGTEGLNDFEQHHYGGPCPPSGTHRYFFKVYALDILLDLPPNADKKQLEEGMKDHILGYGEFIGLYKRQR